MDNPENQIPKDELSSSQISYHLKVDKLRHFE
jgi:hypothetical protein